ncbi:MAG TPA: TonB-dependent receptor [Draconibacterium sp.]|jgi:long-chain fatty acid transport protein|nr:TonB-dependent receptor [Draconibacterium sp.]
MRKVTFLAAFFMLANFAFAGGLLTNTNQSAQFIRMMSRNASLDIDAVYFNPAGLTKLEDGWHFAAYSQTIFQDKTVESGFPLLNDPNYLGKVSVPVFPTAFAVYKMDNWAFSLGFGPNAGGGSAEFERGLPSFEIPISKVVPGLAGLTQINPALKVDGYDADLYFTGSSIFWGIQLGATYQINDMISVYGGVRYMPAKNVYEGSIKDIMIEAGGQMNPASAWLTNAAGMVSAGAALSYGVATSLQPIVTGGGGSFTLSQVEQAGFISAAQKAQIEGGLLRMGITQAQVDVMPVTTVQGTYNAAGNQLTGVAGSLTATSEQMGNKEVKTEQTGAGFTPMIGINISPNDDWNIAVKYEHKTLLTLKNDTEVDDLGLFPDGAESASDVPGILGIGVGYRGMDWLEAQVSYTHYFNKNVAWGMNVRDLSSWQDVDPSKIRQRESNNGYEIGLGLQFNLSDNFAVSVGGLYGDMGILPSYQSDFSYSNSSFTPGAGIMWKITDKITLDAGVSNTFYKDDTVTFADPDVASYNDVYGKTTLSLAAGLSFSIF